MTWNCAILPDDTAQPYRDRKKSDERPYEQKKCCDGGSECSGIFIFKISISRRTFLRNREKTAILKKIDENQNNDRNCEEQLYQRQENYGASYRGNNTR